MHLKKLDPTKVVGYEVMIWSVMENLDNLNFNYSAINSFMCKLMRDP